MELLPEIKKRVSVREFSDEPVSKASLQRILEAGRLAPSAKNRQPWRFVVVQEPAKRELLEKASYGQEYVGRAGAVIACCSTNIEYTMPNGQPAYPVDISIAAAFMALQAVHEDLGTCFVSTFNEDLVRDILSVPFSMRVVLLLLVGKPASVPEARERHAISRVSSWEHW